MNAAVSAPTPVYKYREASTSFCFLYFRIVDKLFLILFQTTLERVNKTKIKKNLFCVDFFYRQKRKLHLYLMNSSNFILAVPLAVQCLKSIWKCAVLVEVRMNKNELLPVFGSNIELLSNFDWTLRYRRYQSVFLFAQKKSKILLFLRK